VDKIKQKIKSEKGYHKKNKKLNQRKPEKGGIKIFFWSYRGIYKKLNNK